MDKGIGLRGPLVVGLLLLLASVSLDLGTSNASAGDITPVWVNETPLGDSRGQAAVVESDGLVYVMGGYTNSALGIPIANASTYNTATGVWTNLDPLPTAVRGAAAAEGPDGRIYVFSGSGASGTESPATQIFDPSDGSWTTGSNIPTPVWKARASTGEDGLIYVMGGYSTTLVVTLDNLQIYDPVGDSWSPGVDMPAARNGGAAVQVDYRIYYIGGSAITWNDASDVVMYYDTEYKVWSYGTSLPVATADLGAVYAQDGHIYALGGAPDGLNAGAGRAEVYYLNFYNSSWTQVLSLNVATENLGAVTTDDGRIWAIGGVNSTGTIKAVQSMDVADLSFDVPTTVAQGGELLIEVGGEFAYSNVLYVSLYVHLDALDGANTPRSAFSTYADSMMFTYGIPETMPAGTYTLVMDPITFQSDAGPVQVIGGKEFSLTITDAQTQDELIHDLQDQITSLQNKTGNIDVNSSGQGQDINQMQNQLNDLQAALDKAKASAGSASLYAMIALVLGAVVVALLALMFVRGRK